MRQNYSSGLNMQIPQENTYTGLEIMNTNVNSLEEFLKENYEFPSDNITEIKKFIQSDLELEKVIMDLPEILSKELQFNLMSLDFMKETDPSEKILEIIIFSRTNNQTLLEKEDEISDSLIDKYPTVNEYIILMEPYVKQ